MGIPTTRRFAMGDALIVIALVAVLCAFYRSGVEFTRFATYLSKVPSEIGYLYRGGPFSAFIQRMPWVSLHEIGMPLLVFGTPAVLLMRLGKPRPPWRDLIRQPGFVACLGLVAAFLLMVDLTWMGVLIPGSVQNPGLIVVACWTVLLLSRQWRSERGWVDRLGRTVGIGWIVMSVIMVVLMRL